VGDHGRGGAGAALALPHVHAALDHPGALREHGGAELAGVQGAGRGARRAGILPVRGCAAQPRPQRRPPARRRERGRAASRGAPRRRRGSCDPASEFMGKLFREHIVFKMNEENAGREDDNPADVDVCCTGQDAKPEARRARPCAPPRPAPPAAPPRRRARAGGLRGPQLPAERGPHPAAPPGAGEHDAEHLLPHPARQQPVQPAAHRGLPDRLHPGVRRAALALAAAHAAGAPPRRPRCLLLARRAAQR